MEEFTYLIVGGGMTADAAVQGIRSLDQAGTIGILSQENDPPYNRPPLTKGLWFGTPETDIARHTTQNHVKLHLGTTAISIDPDAHLVKDQSGKTYHYQQLLLATGSKPKQLPGPDVGVIYLRTLADYHRLRNLYEQGNDFVVIGDGFIGTEMAAALTLNGKNVTFLFEHPSLGYDKFPLKFSKFLSAYFTEQGVQLLPHQSVEAISPVNSKWKVVTNREEALFADGVVAGLGIIPQTELAASIGAQIENGIVVDEFLKTSVADVWAAGDVANFYSPQLEKRVRIDHEDAANSMGKAVGRNMAGASEAFTYLPFFYSDLFEISYEALGEISSEMEIIEEWTDLYREGILYYLRDGIIRGAVAVNVPDQIPKFRLLLGQSFKQQAGI